MEAEVGVNPQEEESIPPTNRQLHNLIDDLGTVHKICSLGSAALGGDQPAAVIAE